MYIVTMDDNSDEVAIVPAPIVYVIIAKSFPKCKIVTQVITTQLLIVLISIFNVCNTFSRWFKLNKIHLLSSDKV